MQVGEDQEVKAFPRLKMGIRLMLAPRSANAKHSTIPENSTKNQELAGVSKFFLGPTECWTGAVLCEQKGCTGPLSPSGSGFDTEEVRNWRSLKATPLG
ncbi:hypothetical protein Tco_1347254 [Tanacetum coccineum]